MVREIISARVKEVRRGTQCVDYYETADIVHMRGCRNRGRTVDRSGVAGNGRRLTETRTRWGGLRLLEYFAGRIKVAQLVLISLRTAYLILLFLSPPSSVGTPASPDSP